MTINVKGYTRHINGKLVTVHGYDANRDSLIPKQSSTSTPVHRVQPVRPAAIGIEAEPGVYVQPRIMQGLGGLTAYLFKPGGPERDLPEYRWRRTMLPKHGAYKIPSNESGDISARQTR